MKLFQSNTLACSVSFQQEFVCAVRYDSLGKLHAVRQYTSLVVPVWDITYRWHSNPHSENTCTESFTVNRAQTSYLWVGVTLQWHSFRWLVDTWLGFYAHQLCSWLQWFPNTVYYPITSVNWELCLWNLCTHSTGLFSSTYQRKHHNRMKEWRKC